MPRLHSAALTASVGTAACAQRRLSGPLRLTHSASATAETAVSSAGYRPLIRHYHICSYPRHVTACFCDTLAAAVDPPTVPRGLIVKIRSIVRESKLAYAIDVATGPRSRPKTDLTQNAGIPDFVSSPDPASGKPGAGSHDAGRLSKTSNVQLSKRVKRIPPAKPPSPTLA